MLGIPAGIALFTVASQGGETLTPPIWALAAVVPGAVVVIAGLTAGPARAGARGPVAGILQAETP